MAKKFYPSYHGLTIGMRENQKVNGKIIQITELPKQGISDFKIMIARYGLEILKSKNYNS